MQFALLLKPEWTMGAANRNMIVQPLNAFFFVLFNMPFLHDAILASIFGGVIQGLITGGFYDDDKPGLFDDKKVLAKSTPAALVTLRLLDAVFQSVRLAMSMALGFIIWELPRNFPVDDFRSHMLGYLIAGLFVYGCWGLFEARKPIAEKSRSLKDSCLNCCAERQNSIVVVEDVSFYQPPSQLEEGGSARNGNHATLTNVVANVIANAAPARSPHGTVSSC
jgi:hypothetical protein